MLLLAVSSCGDDEPSSALPARIEIAPNAVLLTTPGEKKALAAKVYDAQGNPLDAVVEWSSSRPEQVQVDTAGMLTATGTGGSSQIVARLGALRSPPVLVVHTQVPSEALLLTDANIVGEPEETTPDAEASFTNTYRVRLTGVSAPAEGALLINTEGKAVAGRVQTVSSDGATHVVTLGLVPAPELFPSLSIDESIDLNVAELAFPAELTDLYEVVRTGDTFEFTPKAGPTGLTAARLTEEQSGQTGTKGAAQRAMGTAALPPFSSCKAELTGATGAGVLPVGLSVPPLFSITLNNRLEVLYSPELGLERFVIHGAPRITVTAGLKATVAFEGKVTCEVELAIIRIPVGGPLSLIIGGLVPLGVGVELGGKVTLASMALTTKAAVETTFDVGIACPGGQDCELVKDFGERKFTFTPSMDLPGFEDLRLEPSLSAYGFAKASIGNPFLKSLRFQALSVKAGAVLRGSFAPRGAQIRDPVYKSDYMLVTELRASAGAELSGLAQLLGLRSLAAVELVLSAELARSPRGTVTANKAEFVTGDTVNFKVTLDPSTVDALPMIGPYNVRRVLLVRDTDPISPVEVASVSAAAGQTEFDVPFTAPGAGRADEFYAFVVTTLLPTELLALEVGRAGSISEPRPTVTVLPNRLFMNVGDTQQFTATTMPSDLELVWSTNVGTVDQQGLFTAGSTPNVGEVMALAGSNVFGVAAVSILRAGTFRSSSSGANTGPSVDQSGLWSWTVEVSITSPTTAELTLRRDARLGEPTVGAFAVTAQLISAPSPSSGITTQLPAGIRQFELNHLINGMSQVTISGAGLPDGLCQTCDPVSLFPVDRWDIFFPAP